MQETILHKKREAQVMGRRDARARRRSAWMSLGAWRCSQKGKILAAEQAMQYQKVAVAQAVAAMQQVKKPTALTRVKNVFKNIFHRSKGH